MSTPTDRPPPGIGPRKRTAPMWVKLWMVALLANGVGVLTAIWVARLVRGIPESADLELWLRVAYYSVMFVVAVVDAFFLDEAVFQGAFRRTNFGRRVPVTIKSEDDVESVAVTMQRSSVSFPFLVLASMVATYLLFNVVNRDFDAYYRRMGKYVAALSYGTHDEQLQAIAELSIRRDPMIPPLLFRRLQDGGDVASWSAWALGRHYDIARRSNLYRPLLTLVRANDPNLRREALVALGRLQHRGMADELQQEVARDLERGNTVDPRLFVALGNVQVLSSVPVLETVLHRGDERSQRLAAWSLAQHRDQRGGRMVVTILEQRLPSATMPVQCAIVHALGILADEQSNLALLRAFDQASARDRVFLCPIEQVAMRPDGLDDRVELLLPREIFAMKILTAMGQMRATTPGVRAVVEPGLERIIADPNNTAATREAARGLLAGILSQRDDSKKKTASQVFE